MDAHVILVDRDGTQRIYTDGFILFTDDEWRFYLMGNCDKKLKLWGAAHLLASMLAAYQRTYHPSKLSWLLKRHKIEKAFKQLVNDTLREEQSHE